MINMFWVYPLLLNRKTAVSTVFQNIQKTKRDAKTSSASNKKIKFLNEYPSETNAEWMVTHTR